jgi:hypothetical protein
MSCGGGGLSGLPPIFLGGVLPMCSCLAASQAVLERIAGQFGILTALFFLLGLICSFGYKYGAVLFEIVYLYFKSKLDRSVDDV